MGFSMRITRSIQNENGSALFLTVLGLSAVGALVGILITSQAENMAKTGKIYRQQVNNSQVQRELEVIFANPDLCKKVITVYKNTFRAEGVFTIKTGYGNSSPSQEEKPRYVVTSLSLEGTTSTPKGLHSNFSVVTKDANDKTDKPGHKSTVSVIYSANSSGVLTDCRLNIPPKQACGDLGISWNDSSSRCPLCEKMGGTWNGTECSLVTTASK